MSPIVEANGVPGEESVIWSGRSAHVGSDFATVPQTKNRQNLPWNGSDLVYLETGSQALELIARFLKTRGVLRVLVPGYHCQSMIEPLVAAGLEIVLGRVDEKLDFVFSDGWDQVMHDPSSSVILLAAYFGYSPSECHKAAAREARSRGAWVIEDETHRVFQPGGVTSDFQFASLRKLLPVADGAYIRAEVNLAEHVRQLPPSDSDRWGVMDDMARDGMSGRVRANMLEENHRLASRTDLRTPTQRSRDVIFHLPYQDIMDIRRRNGQTLITELEGVAKLLREDEWQVPSHVVLSTEDPRQLQKILAERRIYCPIHWPLSRWGSRGQWRNDLISVPVDHRYGTEDMEHVALAIKEALG